MSTNPFKVGTKSYIDFEIMSDLKWHCTKCELKSGQAKTWQVWKDEKGIQLGQDEKGNYYKIKYCDNCQEKTYHRKLISTDILEFYKPRAGISQRIAKKVKELYKNEEAFYLREFSPNQLEVDHKFSQIRWNKKEEDNEKLSNEELKEKFILLSRQNNLLKSRQCEKCFKTGERGKFPGIYFWFVGSENWDKNIDKHDQKGCIGCFWNNPYRWREELNKKINNS